jgi:hypothetical protein
MAGITLAQAETQLAAYIEAETKVLTGQSYEFNGRSLTRANLAEIRSGITSWDRRVKELSARVGGSGRARIISPRW